MPKRFFLVLVLFVIALSGCMLRGDIKSYRHPEQPRFASLYLAENKTNYHGGLKVVSYNIKLCLSADKIIRLFLENNELANADIICLQEVSLEIIERIARDLKYNYVFYPSAIHPQFNKDWGTVILSKWPIFYDKKIILPHHNKDKLRKIQMAAVKVDIQFNGNKITVVSLHLGAWITLKQRKEQLEAVLREIPPSDRYCIIAGDFNTYSKSHLNLAVNTLENNGFKLATKQVKWTYKYWYLLNRKANLDHIFSRGMEVIKAGSLKNRKISDHLPIWVKLRINELKK